MCDNMSVVMLLHNLILDARTKHIEFVIHFVCECVVEKKLQIQNVPTQAQLVDIFTKRLPSNMFYNF